MTDPIVTLAAATILAATAYSWILVTAWFTWRRNGSTIHGCVAVGMLAAWCWLIVGGVAWFFKWPMPMWVLLPVMALIASAVGWPVAFHIDERRAARHAKGGRS